MSKKNDTWNSRYDLGPELPPPDWYQNGDEPQPDPPPDEEP